MLPVVENRLGHCAERTKIGLFLQIGAYFGHICLASSLHFGKVLLIISREDDEMGFGANFKAEYVAMSALFAVSIVGLVMILTR